MKTDNIQLSASNVEERERRPTAFEKKIEKKHINTSGKGENMGKGESEYETSSRFEAPKMTEKGTETPGKISHQLLRERERGKMSLKIRNKILRRRSSV